MSTKFHDYYQALGVTRTATAEEIQRAYRALARQYHPDVNKDAAAENRFREITEAYEVLKDPKKRERYDALGANWRAGEDFRPPPGWQGGSGRRSPGPEGYGEFSDFFESIFGGNGFDVDEFVRSAGRGGQSPGPGSARRANSPPRARRGVDHEAEVTITLAEAVRGGTRQVHLTSGEEDSESRSYDVRIPPGVTDGSTIRLSGQGGEGRGGGTSGDLLLRIRIAHDPRFRIDPVGGHDLVTVLPITPAEAALGAKVDVATVDGEVRLTVPPGAQSGQRMRIRGHGLSKRSGDRGDLFAELRIVVPRILTDEERMAYEQLARVSADPRSG